MLLKTIKYISAFSLSLTLFTCYAAESGAASADKQAGTTGLSPEQKLAQLSGKPTGTVIYKGANVFAGDMLTLLPDQAIIVTGERIRSIVPSADLDATLLAGAELIDVHGLFVLPGLIDSHVHHATHPNRLFAEGQLKRDLYAGITGVRDMAGDVRFLGDLSRQALINDIPAPDIYYASLVSGPDFFKDPRTVTSALGMQAGAAPWMYAVTDQTDLSLAVAQARGTGATGLKIYANLSGKLVRDLIAEARRQHFPVWTHLQVFPATPYDALGADSVSHVCMIARWAAQPEKDRYGYTTRTNYEGITADHPEIQRYIAALSQSGTSMDATLSVYATRAGAEPAADPKSHCTLQLAGAITRKMVLAGIPQIAGTDEIAAPDDPFPQLNQELEYLVRYAGLSAREAILAATGNAAKVLGKEHDMGTIAVGKYANLVFVKADPTRDIANLRSVEFTVKRGLRFLRSDYHHVPIPDSDD